MGDYDAGGNLGSARVPAGWRTLPAEIRKARLTAAEHAIAGGWESELGEVLDVLGIR